MICTCSCMHECVHVRECVRVHICVSACVMLHMEVGGPLQESALSFFHVSCGNQTQVLRLPNLGTGNRTWVLEGKAKNLELIAQSGWQARFSCFLSPGLESQAAILSFFPGFWAIELKSPCLYSKQFEPSLICSHSFTHFLMVYKAVVSPCALALNSFLNVLRLLLCANWCVSSLKKHLFRSFAQF